MDRRLTQVILTYCMRWPTLGAGLIYLIICGFASQGAMFHDTSLRNALPGMPQPGPFANVTALTQLDAESREARSMFWTPIDVVPVDVTVTKPFNKLLSLQVVGSFKSSDELKVLQNMPHLEGLSLLTPVPPEALTYISSLHHLRYLRLHGDGQEIGLRHLRGLSQLQTLDVLQTRNYAVLLDEILQLPSLTTLILPAHTTTVFNDADWERLKAMPHLSRVYIHRRDIGADHTPMAVARIQQILPRIKVRPATVAPRRAGVWAAIAFASCIAWGVLVFQLQSQFTHSGSRLIPHYATWHLTVSVCLWLAANVIQTVILWQQGCDLSASLAASLFCPGILWGVMYLTLRQSRRPWSAFLPNFVLPLSLQSIVWVTLAAQFFVSDIDWFLDGKQPMMAWSFTLVGMILPGLVLRRIPYLHVLIQEDGVGLPPVGFQLKSWGEWGKEDLLRRQNLKQPFWLTRRSARFDRLLSLPGPRDWPRLWIAGNPLNGLMIARYVLAATTFFLAIFGVVLARLSGNWWLFGPDNPVVPMQTAAWFDMAGLVLLGVWRERRTLLGYESLRPVSRIELVRQLFGAVAFDLRPLFLYQLVVIGLINLAQRPQELASIWLAAALSFWLLRALTMYAAILYFMTVRRTWLLVVSVVAIYFALQMMGAAVLVPLMNLNVWYARVAISVCLVSSLAVGAFLIWLKGHWLRIELA